ncbi:MAG TPA: protein kinase, partial [bacterium]|nr:protein kinase [bacterium]
MLGTTLGHYEIVEKIGAGGMGEVYRARDTRLNRDVAVKVLPSHVSASPDARQRFEREARVISSLSHPNICTLHDVGHENGVDFLVMEYLEGETLHDRLGREPFVAAEVMRIGRQIADALDRAHRAGIVHRDLKPGNVMLTRDGVKLLDFGLAKTAETSAATVATEVLTEANTEKPLTARGTILGTFQYMAPEQLEGRDVDARTDIFALGAVLYEMATGQRAFAGQSQASLIAAILEREPAPISELQPLTPPAFERTVRKCLAKEPDDRWQTARDVASELQWISEESSAAGLPRAVSSRRKSRERLAWGIAAALFLIAAALAWTTLQLRGRPERVVRALVPPPEGTHFDLDDFFPGPVAISPDGRRLASVIESEDGSEILWVRSVDALSGQPIAGTEGASYPFWSPDNRMIAFFAGGKLRKVGAEGGAVLTLCDAENGKGGSWGSRGDILFAPRWDAPILRVSAAGGEPDTVTKLDLERREDSHRLPWFLPDGRRFLYFARSSTGRTVDRGSIMLGSLEGDAPRELLRSGSGGQIASGHL